MKTSLQRTFAGAEGKPNASALLHHNSKPETAEKCAALQKLLKTADRTSYAGLMAYGNFGVGLIDLKKHLKEVKEYGQFESVVSDEFKIGSTWRTQLMYLGQHLSKVEPAIAWGRATNRFIGTQYPVAVVNSLIKAFLKRDDPVSLGETVSPPEQREMSWSDVLGVIDWAKTYTKDANYDLDQMGHLLREWESDDEKTGSASTKSVKRNYPKDDIIKALVLTSNIANLVFSKNQQLRERIAVLDSELERERARSAQTTPEPSVKEAVLLRETIPEALITSDGGSELSC
jgi:hypothetical protein